MENGFSSHAHSFCVRFSEHVCEQGTLVSIRLSNPTAFIVVVVVVVGAAAAAVVVDVGCPLSLPSFLLSPFWRVLATTAFRYHIHKTYTPTHSTQVFSLRVCV